MERVSTILTPEQEKVLSLFHVDQYLTSTFYFTGGTALSECYYQHRYSEDLDFFTPESLDVQTVYNKVETWVRELSCTFRLVSREGMHFFFLTFPNGEELKVDFVHYPYQPLEAKKNHNGIQVDSLRDIATNKLLCIQQRTDAKDFVDLYFLLKEYNLWSITYGMEKKFAQKIDPFILGSDLMKVDDFDAMPRMISKLTLAELQEFFHNEATALGYTATEDGE